MNNPILGSLAIIILTLILNIIIDYYVLKVDNNLIGFVKGIKKNKEYLITYLASIIMQTVLFILMRANSVFYISYFTTLIFYRIAIIDYKTKYVDNKLLLLLLITAIISLGVDNNLHMIEGILTGLAAYIILAIFSKITGESFGMGDAKVLGLLGLIYGFQGIMSILLVSSVVVFFVSLFLMIKSKENKSKELPFTPYIFLGLMFMLIISNI